MTYGGEFYSFPRALAEARKRQRLDGLDADAIYWRTFYSAPTVAQLRKHAERFGGEFVRETAAAFGIDLRAGSVAEKPKRQRRTGPTLKAQVLDLRARGVMPATIADTLNISDRRVASILRDAA
jgi:hypothetical protein